LRWYQVNLPLPELFFPVFIHLMVWHKGAAWGSIIRILHLISIPYNTFIRYYSTSSSKIHFLTTIIIPHPHLTVQLNGKLPFFQSTSGALGQKIIGPKEQSELVQLKLISRLRGEVYQSTPHRSRTRNTHLKLVSQT